MIPQLAKPYGLIPPPAHQSRRHYPAAAQHLVAFQHRLSTLTFRFRAVNRVNRRPASGHSHSGRTERSQPRLDLFELGILTEYDRLEVVPAERTRRRRRPRFA